MGLSLEEQETHISYGREDSRAVIYASDSTTITKLDKQVCSDGTEWRLESESWQKGELIGKTYSCPKEFITFRSKKRDSNMTEEQRAAAAERMKMIRQN